jgi:class 3 adenylate cyclase
MNVLPALFARLGPRYPRFVVLTLLALSYVVVGIGVAALLLYQDMTTGQFLRLLLVEYVLLSLENARLYRAGKRILSPASPWLEGDRTPEAAAAAWRALAHMPFEYTRRMKDVPLLVNAPLFCAYAIFDLGLPWWSFFFLFAGAIVVLGFGLYLRFFTLEWALRPVLTAAAKELADDADLGRAGVTLRFRLLVGLPLLNVITGVVVAGLADNDGAELSALGLNVAVAVAVAFTISFDLTLLLTRSILAPIGDLRDATKRVAEGDFSARVPVTSNDEIGELARSFNQMVGGLDERERLREAFGAYVDPQVASRVLEEGTALEGEDVEVTVLFLDIRGFTALAERAPGRELVGRLNRFYELVVPILGKHGGHANKFVGDGLLAVFGTPEHLADHADRGVAAAFEIDAAVRTRFGDDLRIGIGVNSGPVVAGTVGGGGKVEFTVIGDTVNTAARVEEATRVSGDDILLTEATRTLLTRDFGAFEARPPMPLKGKSEPVRLYAPAPTAEAVVALTKG